MTYFADLGISPFKGPLGRKASGEYYLGKGIPSSLDSFLNFERRKDKATKMAAPGKYQLEKFFAIMLHCD